MLNIDGTGGTPRGLKKMSGYDVIIIIIRQFVRRRNMSVNICYSN